MKNIIINEHGLFLGLKSSLLVIKKDGKTIREIALNRIKTIQIFSNGISISSALIISCANRGIKIFFNSYDSFSALHTLYEHKSANIRQKQFEVCYSQKGIELARNIIIGKLKNQRATILYSSRLIEDKKKDEVIDFFDKTIFQLKNKKNISKEFILGCEGSCAKEYFEYLKNLNLLPDSFILRTKRNSQEITNIALNYGYAILFNFIYKSCINAGLEPYIGILHTLKSSKPSLVLDIMEEYRSFVVDRNIIKLRFKLQKSKDFNKVKKDVASNILSTIHKKYKYNHKKLTLESIIQRQVYKISGYFSGNNKYKSYIFRW